SNGTTADSSTPLVAVTPAFVHLVWLDHASGTFQLHYRRRAVGTAPPGPDAGVADSGGSCGRPVCHGEVCMNSAPACAPGRTPCGTPGGCLGCRNLDEDPANCGMCGRACSAGEACSGGQCVAMCPAGSLACGLSCVADPENDVAF